MPVDLRFFEPIAQLTVKEVAELTGAELIGGNPDEKLNGLAAAQKGRRGDLVFVEGDAKAAASVSNHASACFVTAEIADRLPDTLAKLVVTRPRWGHTLASRAMFRLRDWNDEGDAPKIHETARIGKGAVIGAGSAIGEGTSVGPNVVIGPGVQIGGNCRIGPNASIRNALIGNNVSIHSGVVIGEAGFGVLTSSEGAEDAPQFGRVILQDHVTVGANTCIDRGAFDDTIIGERTKIDNLCQIGHNAQVGRNVVLASFAGISGTSVLGDGVMAGGRVGIADHVEVGQGAKLAANSGIFRDIPSGETWGGSPAKPIKQWMRELAWLQKQTQSRKKS